ncbi:S-layer homology domain-containing protein [Brevibacillus ginsengisoli]|uniref:S-layer homology domain-containing protein n=1 Tax=Brevibacillus ginsengisoli TaxID=363854 RepID=UPI003CEF92C2
MQDSGFKKKNTSKNNFPQDQLSYTRGGEPKVMKKVVNSVLASALALTVAPMVVGAETATTTAPQIDPALDKVVKRLSALGLVEGMGNGDMAIGSNITRSQFATLVVRARGLASGVPLAQNVQRFADVKTADWFSGWVNVAAGQELIKGYPNNTFGPSNNVTYAEAVAMLVRALGYDVNGALKGTWPNNYISKAAELGISKGVKVDPNKPATRGDIFMMLDNSLTIDLLKAEQYGNDTKYTVQTDKTLLTEYLNVSVYDMDWANNKTKDNVLPFVSNVPVTALGNIKSNEVAFAKQSGSALSGKTLKVADGINPNDFAGEHVQVWVKDDRNDTIVWMEQSDDEEVINDKLDTFYYDNVVIKNDKFWSDDKTKNPKLDKFEVKMANGKTYRFADDFKITYNYKNYDKHWDDAFKDIAIDYDNVDAYSTKVVLNNNGEIQYMSVVDDITADKDSKFKFGSEVAKKVDVDKKKISTLDGKDLDLKNKDEGKDFLVIRNGKPAKLADLKDMDVYSVYYSNGDKDRKIIVANSTVVEGKVDDVEYRSTNKANNNFLKIGDKKYRIRNASFSDDKNKTIETWGNNEADKFLDLEGLNVKLYLDSTGRVRHIETTTPIKERAITGVVTKDVYYDELKDVYSLTVYNEKNAKANLEVTDSKYFKGLTKSGKDATPEEIKAAFKVDKDQPVIVRYQLDSAGKVKEVKLINDELTDIAKDKWNRAADEDDNLINYNGESLKVKDDAVVFDLTSNPSTNGRHEWKDVKTAKFKNIAKDDYHVLVHEKDGEADYMYVLDGDKSVASTGEYGIVVSFSHNSNDDFINVLTKDGSVQKYKLDGTVDGEFGRFDAIRYELNTDNELVVKNSYRVVKTEGNSDDVDLVRVDTDNINSKDINYADPIRVDAVDGNKITYKDADGKKRYYYTTSNTVYYNDQAPEKVSELSEGDYAVLIDTDDDGTAVDYAIIVTDQDFVKDMQLDMSGFLTTKDTGEHPGPDVTVSGSGSEKALVPGFISDYTIKGTLKNLPKNATASVVVTIGGTDQDVDVDSTGAFEVTIREKAGLKTAKVTATVNDEELDAKTVNITPAK